MSNDALDARAQGARRFVGKVAVVAGGGQGIGSATVRRLAQEGAHVVIADRVEATARTVEAGLTAQRASSSVFVGDLTSHEVASDLMASVHAEHGRIDVLVNIVGGTILVQPFVDYTPEQIRAEVDRSFWPAIWCCWAAAPFMRAQGSGAIVNLGSHSTVSTMRVPYAASKGGVVALTTSLAKELAPFGVRVNCVVPHATTADDRTTARDGSTLTAVATPGTLPLGSTDLARLTLAEIPMGRFALAEEQASAIAFLGSDDASFITGQVLPVGGGATWR
jgi:dihydroxycyclohexadiene carboxylate dehydrogenase